jgi:DNA polymerase III gamma/tau subunit
MVLSLSKLNSKELFPYLKNLCVKEEKSIRDDVLDSISHVANGSVRQALSLLEIAFHMEGSDPETVLKYLKILSPKVCKDILMLILNGKTKEAVSFWTDLQSQGYDEKAFFHRFSELVYRLCEAKLNETDNEYKQLLDQYNLSYQLLINFWEIIIAQMEALYNGCFFTVETTLILLSLIEDKTDLISEAKRVFPSLKVL